MRNDLAIVALILSAGVLYVASLGLDSSRIHRHTPTVNSWSPPRTVDELFADLDQTTAESRFLKEKMNEKRNFPQIRKVRDGVYLALGYALGNSIWLLTPNETIVVIDTPEHRGAALEIRRDMRRIKEIGNKPIAAIVFTLFHIDHIIGAKVFVSDPANKGIFPRIIAQERLVDEAEFYETFQSFKLPRLTRMFGLALPKDVYTSAAPRFRLDTVALEILPSDRLTMKSSGEITKRNIDGLLLEFVYIPGYTSDQIAVYVPEYETMLAADAFYWAWPNLYTLRGEPSRDAVKWAAGTRILRNYKSRYLIPSHSQEMQGVQEIDEALQNYADAIQFVHDQTVRYINKGLPADSISNHVEIPNNLKSKPYLSATYGVTETAVKAIADTYVGWFSGEATDLLKLSRMERARKMADYFGEDRILQTAEEAYSNRDWKFALELANYVYIVSGKKSMSASLLRSAAIKRIAERTANPLVRNYLLTQLMEDWGLLDINRDDRSLFQKLSTVSGTLKQMALHINAAKTEGVRKDLCLEFIDDQSYRLEIRNSILAVEEIRNPVTCGNTTTLRISFHDWKLILSGSLSNSQLVSSSLDHIGCIVTDQSTAREVQEFLHYFDFGDVTCEYNAMTTNNDYYCNISSLPHTKSR